MANELSSNEVQLVVFRLDREEYGIDILMVQEIKKMTEITRVPHTPDYIKGVMNLRGSVLPVLDLKLRLGLPPGSTTEDTRIVIVKTGDAAVGVLVDSVSEVVGISRDKIEPPQNVGGMISQNYLSGVGKLDNRLLILLDIHNTISIN